jgi:DNA-binding NarL/FixJ family response regulator
MLSDEMAVLSALGAGANGYMVKDCTSAELVDAVSRVAAGERVFAASISPLFDRNDGVQEGSVFDAGADHSRPLLSRREEEVLRMMAKGVSLTEAASRLYISVKTVKNHLSSIYEKLGCHDRAQAVLRAVRMGLIQLD